MAHPRIEEVSDSEASDPSEGDVDDFDDADIIRRVVPATSAAAVAPQQQQQQQQQAIVGGGNRPMATTADAAAWADAQALYPVYFDAGRSRAEGRRVARHLAVRSPLARQVVEACASLGLRVLFEPTKTHPKDWANPGRVKVSLKKAGAAPNTPVHNKHHLYLLVAAHLRANPVADDSPFLREHIVGGPPPPPVADASGDGDGGNSYPRPAVPRGWKVGEFLPYYSPAMTGGAISENFFMDMMKGMQQAAASGDVAGMFQGAGGPSGSITTSSHRRRRRRRWRPEREEGKGQEVAHKHTSQGRRVNAKNREYEQNTFRQPQRR